MSTAIQKLVEVAETVATRDCEAVEHEVLARVERMLSAAADTR